MATLIRFFKHENNHVKSIVMNRNYERNYAINHTIHPLGSRLDMQEPSKNIPISLLLLFP